MIKWTTPTLKCTIPKEIVCDYILLTISQGSAFVEKEIPGANIEEGVFYVVLNQEETSKFKTNQYAYAQLNIMKGNKRLGTNKVQLMVDSNLHNEVIEI